jgi:hypothetical protein
MPIPIIPIIAGVASLLGMGANAIGNAQNQRKQGIASALGMAQSGANAPTPAAPLGGETNFQPATTQQADTDLNGYLDMLMGKQNPMNMVGSGLSIAGSVLGGIK